MSNRSLIEWTEKTWNPVTGCTKCNPGCQNCYALVMSNRLAGFARGHPGHAGKTFYYQDVVSGSRSERLQNLAGRAALAGQPVDGRQRREQRLGLPGGSSAAGTREGAPPLAGTAARAAPGPPPGRHPLGDRRRRVECAGPADAPRMGEESPGPLRRAADSLSSNSGASPWLLSGTLTTRNCHLHAGKLHRPRQLRPIPPCVLGH